MHINYSDYVSKYVFRKLFIFCCLFLMAGNLAYGQFATGGDSPYRDQVLWLTWGDGPNGTAEQDLNVGASSSSSFTVPGGEEMELTCSIDAITHGAGDPNDEQLRSYMPGQFFGDALDNLYNIGGEGFSNELINGIERSDGITDFTIGCEATLDGAPYNLKGLVMADAEAIRPNDEYVEATAEGTWNVVEMLKNLGDPDPYMAQKTNNGDGTQTIRFGPGTDFETAAVTFLSFTNPSSTFDMDFSIRGGDVTGTTAIAIGLLVHYADLGDAPASYGDAIHLIQDVQFEDDNLPADGVAQDLNVAAYEPGGLAYSITDYIGSQGVDTELEQPYGADADDDDEFPSSGSSEEDAWADNYSISVVQGGQNLSESVACTGTGTVAGWIDFDGNGTFDSDERAEATCSGGAASLSWTVPTDITVGVSYVRLRYSTNSAELADPTGVASDGEVEDHAIEIQAEADLGIAKTVDQTSAMVGDDVTFTLTATNDGPSDATNVTVIDQLPDGYNFVSADPAADYNQSTGEWTIGNLANGASQTLEITAEVQGSGNYTNAATIDGDEADSNNDNDSDSQAVTTSTLASFQACTDQMFLSQAATTEDPMDLIQIDQSTNPFTFNNIIGTTPDTYNAIAYNEADNFIYAIGYEAPYEGHLLRLGSGGNIEDLGAITGFSGLSVAGEIDPDGNYYIKNQSTGDIAVVDISSVSVTSTLTIGSDLIDDNYFDLAWHDGMLYTVSGTNSALYSIDPNDGTSVQIGPIGISEKPFGALYGAANGIFGNDNEGSGFYQFNTNTGEATLISDSPGASLNDGAKCASSTLTYQADLSISKTDNETTYTLGETVTYEIVVSNDGPFGASGAVVNDPLPAGITNATWTCAGADGGVCGASSGTGNINGVEVELPYDQGTSTGGSATFTLEMDIPAGFTGDLVNTAEVVPGSGTDDPNPSNNESSDTNTRANLVLELTGGECFRLLSSPVEDMTYQTMLQNIWTQGAANSNYSGGDANVWSWDIDAQDWAPVSDLDTVIPAGEGFLVSVFADDDYDGTADPFPKTLTLPTGSEYAPPLAGSFGTAGTDDWVLLGNPFQSNIATGDLTGTATDLYDAYYVYDRNLPGWRSTASGFGDLTDAAIAAGQGFFVQASGASPALDFTDPAKTTDGEFYGKQAEKRDYVRLEMSGEGVSNSLWIRFSQDGSQERTVGDALSLEPLSEQYALIGATKADGNLMDIAHYPLSTDQGAPLEIPVSAEATEPGRYTLSAAEMDRPAGMTLYLYDRQTGESVQIDDQFEYTFSISQAGKIPEPETGEMVGCTVTPQRAKASGANRFLITSAPGAPTSERPEAIALDQNYPNPFNPTTQITYRLPEQSQVRLEVFDMTGRMVATLVNEQVAAGTHQVNFDAGGLSSGIYLYRLQTNRHILTKKLTLIK